MTISSLSYLQVRWDDLEVTRHNRVSPWEIEPSGSASTANNLMSAGLKRTKIGLPSAKLEFPVSSMSHFFLVLFLSCPTKCNIVDELFRSFDRCDWNIRLWGITKVPEGLARSRNVGC